VEKQARRQKGDGSIYLRGRIYWIGFMDPNTGMQINESSRSTKRKVANKLLKKRQGEVVTDQFVPGVDKIMVAELCDGVVEDYETKEQDTLDKAERSSKRIKAFFGGIRAADHASLSKRIVKYIKQRRAEGAENSTINRELAFLKRAYNLGVEQKKINLSHVPHIEMLPEKNVRQGFFEYAEFVAVRDAALDWFKPVVVFAYYVPWRKENVLELQWQYVDLENELISIPAEETKNEKAIRVVLEGELLEMLQDLYEKRSDLCPFVFTHDGKQTKDPRHAWHNSCVAVGLGRWVEAERKGKKVKVYQGKLFHDLRRTGVRDHIRSGTTERVVMEISGHKTRSTFDRYNITSEQDLREAAKRRRRYAQEQAEKATRKVKPLRGVSK